MSAGASRLRVDTIMASWDSWRTPGLRPEATGWFFNDISDSFHSSPEAI
jgi:hypothetical protein